MFPQFSGGYSCFPGWSQHPVGARFGPSGTQFTCSPPCLLVKVSAVSRAPGKQLNSWVQKQPGMGVELTGPARSPPSCGTRQAGEGHQALPGSFNSLSLMRGRAGTSAEGCWLPLLSPPSPPQQSSCKALVWVGPPVHQRHLSSRKGGGVGSGNLCVGHFLCEAFGLGDVFQGPPQLASPVTPGREAQSPPPRAGLAWGGRGLPSVPTLYERYSPGVPPSWKLLPVGSKYSMYSVCVGCTFCLFTESFRGVALSNFVLKRGQ